MRTKRNNYFCVLIILLVLIEITSIFLMYKSSNNRNTLLDNVNLKEQIKEMKGIAIMLEQSDGTYKESSTNTFPTNLKFNKSLSGCIDNLGNKIYGAIEYSKGVVNVTTSSTSFCYLYFSLDKPATDEIIAIAGDDLWNSTLEGDGYRFVGTNPDNYICFGTTSQSECMSDTDKYMYRIIGIFEDSEGAQHLKLIKKEALNETYAWSTNKYIDIDLEDSDLYNGINGDYFLNNTTYSYMQDYKWKNKIEDWKYTSTNTLSYENQGPDYRYDTAQNVYLHELNRNSKTNLIGEWTYVSGKIGLMYASDYLLSLGSSALNYTSSSNASTLKTGWMHISNNDSDALSQYEWTSSRNGDYQIGDDDGMWYGASIVYNDGSLNGGFFDDTHSVRPVFYLKSDLQLAGGTGTSTDPYMIEQKELTDTEKLIENVSSDVLWESTLEDDGYRFVGTNPDNYICFGTTDKSTCTGNTDLYMYRIIGIFEDSEGEQHLKLIKKEALNTSYAWNADYKSDVAWNASDIYKGINGSYFLNNTTYSYMQNSTWTNKIATWDYTATNTKTYESSGMDYYSSVVRQTYLHEMNRSTKTSTVGVWDTVSAKIGLMYVSDYQLSLGSTALDYTNIKSAHYASMKTGWMHISNNDSGAPSQYEWTMSRYGVNSSGYYFAWGVYSNGRVNYYDVSGTRSVRPVFYLESDVMISGEGTSTSPYIIS